MNSLYKSNLYKNYRGLLISFIDVCIVFLAYIVAFLIQNNFLISGRVITLTKLLGLGLQSILLCYAYLKRKCLYGHILGQMKLFVLF